MVMNNQVNDKCILVTIAKMLVFFVAFRRTFRRTFVDETPYRPDWPLFSKYPETSKYLTVGTLSQPEHSTSFL